MKEGYDRASTNKVALAAGVSVGSLYQYFPSKEALVAALIEDHMRSMHEVIVGAFPRLAASSIEDAAEEAVRIMVEAHAIDPKLHKVLVEQVPRVGSLEKVVLVEEEMRELVKAYLETKRSEIVVVDLDMAAFIVVSIVESLTHHAVLLKPDMLTKKFVKEVATVVVRYLKGGRA